MLKRLKSLFDAENQNHQPSETDVQLAAATLMFEMIRSDGKIDDVELAHMLSLIHI